jgi:hypothetical protein
MIRLIQYCLIVLLLLQAEQSHSQTNPLGEVSKEQAVSEHKQMLHLTLVIDSVVIGSKTYTPGTKYDLNFEFESDYLKIRDDVYIKIFVARNQEYGSKFYSWKWDYLKKKPSGFTRLGNNFYDAMEFNSAIGLNSPSQAQGIGYEGKPDYYMFYYRYKLE